MKLPEIGDVIGGKHLIEEVLGEGGFGVVYRATTEGTNRPVAVKLLKPGPEGYDATRKERFLRELRAIAMLQDPHTLTLFDYGETEDGSPFMVTEYVEGEDLEVLLNRRGVLSAPEIVHVLLQVLYSLKEAHENGILHRDIKPANIRLFQHNEDPLRVKVLDFGLAKSLAAGEQRLTAVGRVIGTPRYMSPEQLQGHELTAATDVYSLGVVGYEMVRGRTATAGEDPGSQRRLTAADRVPANLRSIVNRMLQNDVANRFQTAADAVDALHPLRRGPVRPVAPREPREPVEPDLTDTLVDAAAPVLPQPRAKPTVRVLLGVGTLVGLVVAVGAWAWGGASDEFRAPRVVAPPPLLPASLHIADVPRSPSGAPDLPSPHQRPGLVELVRRGASQVVYSAYVPPSAAARRLPLVLFVDESKDHTLNLTEFPALLEFADASGFVIVGVGVAQRSRMEIPRDSHPGYNPISGAVAVEDAKLVEVPLSSTGGATPRQLWMAVDAAAESVQIDESRVYVVGDSLNLSAVLCEPPVAKSVTTGTGGNRPPPCSRPSLHIDHFDADQLIRFFNGEEPPAP